MASFNDKCSHLIDQKGRLQLSKEVRADFDVKKGDKLFLLPATDGEGDDATTFLEIRNEAQWTDYQDRFLSEAPAHMARDFIRFIQLNREMVVADAQGRISLPKRIRALCKLNKEVVVINLGRVVEVWTSRAATARQNDFKKAHSKISKRLW